MIGRDRDRHADRGEARGEPAVLTLLNTPAAARETVILDPPRAGLDKDVRRALVRRSPARSMSAVSAIASSWRRSSCFEPEGSKTARSIIVSMLV